MTKKILKSSALVFALIVLSAFKTFNLTHLNEITGQEPDIGIKIVDAQTGKTLYEKNADKSFTPASVQKVVTALAAFHYLGPNFQFATTLVTNSFDAKKRSIGDLYLVGAGDPEFSICDIDELVSYLKEQNINKITGKIYIDNSLFDEQTQNTSWLEEDKGEGYAAKITPLSLESNKLTIEYMPGAAKGAAARIFVHPYTNYVQLKNQTSSARSKAAFELSPLPKNTPTGLKQGAVLTAKGRIGPNATPRYENYSLADPVDFAGYILKQKLSEKGIKFSKSAVTSAKSPSQPIVLGTHHSRLLSAIIAQALKFSHNHTFELLLKRMGNEASKEPGTYANGVSAISQFLSTQVGVSRSSCRVADGCGLSRENRVSPHDLTQILLHGLKELKIGPEFVSSFPVSGMDGTLRSFALSKGLVRAKTGTMSDLRQLAGYAYGANGDIFIFAILGKENPEAQKKMLKIQRDILEEILR